MEKVPLDEIKARLAALGYKEDEIKTVIEDAIEGARKADAIYLNRRGTDRLFECAVVQCQFVDRVAHWFFQDSADKASPEASK